MFVYSRDHRIGTTYEIPAFASDRDQQHEANAFVVTRNLEYNLLFTLYIGWHADNDAHIPWSPGFSLLGGRQHKPNQRALSEQSHALGMGCRAQVIDQNRANKSTISKLFKLDAYSLLQVRTLSKSKLICLTSKCSEKFLLFSHT